MRRPMVSSVFRTALPRLPPYPKTKRENRAGTSRSLRPVALAEMEAIIAKDEALHLGHFYKSQRHTIQVDFGRYVHDLMKEIGRGERR